jgi:hypothetical protein
VKNDVAPACPPERCDGHGQCDGDVATPCGYTAYSHHQRQAGGFAGKRLVFTPCLEGLPSPCADP